MIFFKINIALIFFKKYETKTNYQLPIVFSNIYTLQSFFEKKFLKDNFWEKRMTNVLKLVKKINFLERLRVGARSLFCFLYLNSLYLVVHWKLGATGIDDIWDVSNCKRRMTVPSLIICYNYKCRLRLHGCSLSLAARPGVDESMVLTKGVTNIG